MHNKVLRAIFGFSLVSIGLMATQPVFATDSLGNDGVVLIKLPNDQSIATGQPIDLSSAEIFNVTSSNVKKLNLNQLTSYTKADLYLYSHGPNITQTADIKQISHFTYSNSWNLTSPTQNSAAAINFSEATKAVSSDEVYEKIQENTNNQLKNSLFSTRTHSGQVSGWRG